MTYPISGYELSRGGYIFPRPIAAVNRRCVISVFVLATTGAAGCARDEASAPLVESDIPVRITRHRLVRSDEGTSTERVAVEGTVTPTRDVDIGYVELVVTFIDREGAVLNRTTGTIEAYETDTWPFRIEFPYEGERAANVVDYEIELGMVL